MNAPSVGVAAGGGSGVEKIQRIVDKGFEEGEGRGAGGSLGRGRVEESDEFILRRGGGGRGIVRLVIHEGRGWGI